LLTQKQADGIPVILACSALKESYRNMLYKGRWGCE
jgi:gluconate kinase